jgi:hypothetical protein
MLNKSCINRILGLLNNIVSSAKFQMEGIFKIKNWEVCHSQFHLSKLADFTSAMNVHNGTESP